MSLANLLNKEDEDPILRTTATTTTTATPHMNNATKDERKRIFLEELNNNFNILNQRDKLETIYQNWKFLNLQEFELINEWNNQSKDWFPSPFSSTSPDDLHQINGVEHKVPIKRKNKSVYDEIELIRNEVENYKLYKESNNYLKSGIASTTAATTTTAAAKKKSKLKSSKRQQKSQKQKSLIKKDTKKKSKIKTELQTPSTSTSNSSPNDIVSEQDGEDEENENDYISDVFEDDDEDIKIIDDENDEDFQPENESKKSSKKSKNTKKSLVKKSNEPVTLQSDKDLIVRDLKKMVKKNKLLKIKKRKFTSCLVVDYVPPTPPIDDESDSETEFNDAETPSPPQLIMKLTLKQFHMRKLKKIFNERKKAKEKEIAEKLAIEKAKKIRNCQQFKEKIKTKIKPSKSSKTSKSTKLNETEETSDNDDIQQDHKKRKLNDQESSMATTTTISPSELSNTLLNKESSATIHDLPTYGMKMSAKEARAIKRHYDNTYITIWKDLARKDSAKMLRLIQQIQSIKSMNFKKTSSLVARESKKWQIRNFKQVKDLQTRARRGIREMSNYWKKNEREERDLKKKAEKIAQENAKKEEEEKETIRQSKKLNFLLTQTELYSHFIGRKIKTTELEGNMTDDQHAAAMTATATTTTSNHIDLEKTEAMKNDFHSIDFDNEDDEQLRLKAAQNASNVLAQTRAKAKAFDDEHNNLAAATAATTARRTPTPMEDNNEGEFNFQNPTSLGEISIEQPKMLACTLKEYQLKGLNWLASLYDQGINGILADEMGLGKTVQSISVLAHLAEKHNIWGPYLVVTPASTLHNWVNEITKFVPGFKILPYWGNANDRKVLRKFWDRKNLRYTKDSPFHVMITSYQMVVSDVTYLQKMKWQYMILDEAQAIKSSSSSRWKNLLSFHCRNRLLLTGTPIQNNMQELWALLHFIMPSLFDSHDEFSEWFAKDIESHAESNTKLNQQQLRRLHMILKPFMLRRVKKNVQSELGDKIEIDLMCDLTQRQAKLYNILKSQISSNYDAIENAASSPSSSASPDESLSDQNLANAVMQFRKVCNHPDLFERADVDSPFGFVDFGKTSSIMRSDNNNNGDFGEEIFYSSKNPITYNLPSLVYKEIIQPNYKNNIDIMAKLLNYNFTIFNPKNNLTLCRYLSRITSLSPNELSKISHKSLLERAISLDSEIDGSNFIEKLSILFPNSDDDENDGIKLKDNFEKNLKIVDKTRNLRNLSRTCTDGVLQSLLNIKEHVYQENYFNSLHRSYRPNASSVPISIEVNGSNHFSNQMERELFNPTIAQALSEIPPITQYRMHVKKHIPIESFPSSDFYPQSLNKFFTSTISMPSMDRFITESAKLKKLDELLVQLKKEDHRVLIYFQMTKMMDLMEEYLTYRQYSHIRLDGSSKLEDRRDLVHDWQTKPEIFVFLLSTRAGGLGINLTAADTVIFYDSDWNPTIDSQAMDRAHRLGQTRQVTVYRLLVRGTIEERMRDRAKQKEQVQQVVMEGKTQDNNVKTIEASKF
ncbi:chromatin-remodeling ATPase INO80 NDAI_0H03390 [Naumovozyma dairenensis CBS 421]|uniref:Chromatin-remodeling ATPase INO80 n=1 Tax=Naumovozyma dairenensis (strain ATCC 10597 / BCRC 20456 / CBS 421 / NBRC 0211 / NRRL Y-12639) TaxID=1071378 RepID=G0WFF1_NAUDC|nr:hypothetical protein NDAI_0H03390 [Naumovozyma dairenensis CBS 421]CCD26512.1 hypothetical protein NDAI_0H03390 [Naumovozyma dairenensis CBS 421]